MTWSNDAQRDRESFADLEKQIRDLMLKVYDLGHQDKLHELTILIRRGRRWTPCKCGECTAPA